MSSTEVKKIEVTDQEKALLIDVFKAARITYSSTQANSLDLFKQVVILEEKLYGIINEYTGSDAV